MMYSNFAFLFRIRMLLFNFIFFHIDSLILLLSLLPTLACILLHIDDGIVLIDDLETENSLNNILERKNADEHTILIDDLRYLALLLEHGIKDSPKREVLVKRG